MNTCTLENLARYVATPGSNQSPIAIRVGKDGQSETMTGHIIRVKNDGFIFYETDKPASENTLKPPLIGTKNFHMNKPTIDGYTFQSME